MAMSPAELEDLIKQAIPDAQVNIEDLRGDGDHYAAYVVSPAFKGKTRVQQHQMVYEALQGRFPDEERVALTRIPDRDAIVASIKALLSTGR